jgi:hypothetical protein
MPDKVRQTGATRRAARHFGIASRKGKLIRKAFHPHLDMRYDGTLVNRLNKLFIQAGRDHFPNLQHFHFNRHTGIEKLFVEQPVFTANGTLHIPAQELLPQGSNTHIELRLIATRISFAENRVISTDVSTAIIELNEDEPFNGMAMNVPIDGKGTLIVALQYRSCKECNGHFSFSGDRRYMAADVIHINVPAEKEPITAALIKKAPRKRLVFRQSSSVNAQGANKASSPQGTNGPPSPSLRSPSRQAGRAPEPLHGPRRSNLPRQ